MPRKAPDKFENVVILTGAGLSAESGVQTFRDPDGIWAQYDIEDVATPEAFARNPKLVQDFYNQRRTLMRGIQPNEAHKALARLEQNFPGKVLIVTQNIDNLHEAAGSRQLIHMHGELAKSLCAHCEHRAPCDFDLSLELSCENCGRPETLRPDVVWFGEMPYRMEEIYEALVAADLFISIGTSGNVYPAAGFVSAAREVGAYTVELNLEPSEGARLFDECHHGPATKVVPDYVAQLLQN